MILKLLLIFGFCLTLRWRAASFVEIQFAKAEYHLRRKRMKRALLFVLMGLTCVSGAQAMDAYPLTQLFEVGAATW